MALQNPNTLYSGGDVLLDGTPTINFYRQIEAERRAKQDAIDEYMRGLRSKVTPAGMRTADLPAFDKMRKDWQDFGILNREKIARSPQLRSQFEAMGQDLLSFAEESKAQEAAKKPFIEILTDPNKRNKVRPEVFGMITEHDKPLYTTDAEGNLVRDFNRKKIDYNSPLFKDPEFDFQKEYKGWIGELKPSETVELDKPYTDKQTGLVFYPSKEKFNKQQIDQVGRNAERAIRDNEDKFDYYSGRLAAITQKEYENLDGIYRKYYGQPIGKSPEKLAAAEAIAATEQSVRDLKPVSKLDYERRLGETRTNIVLSHQPTTSSTVVSGNVIDELPDINLKSGGKIKDGQVYDKDGNLYNGAIVLGKQDLSASLVSVLKSAGIDIEKMGRYVDAKVKDGKIMSIKPQRGNEISRQFVENAQMKFNTEPQKGNQPKFGNQPPTQKPKTKKGELD